MNNTLIITRGGPGSGKSTWARKWVQEAPERRVRVNRDDLRVATYGAYRGLSREQEETITRFETSLVESALRAGKDVVVDAMHLRASYVKNWAKVAAKHGAGFQIETFTVDPTEAVRRIQERAENRIPAQTVLDIYKRLTDAGKPRPVSPDLDSLQGAQIASYVPNPALPATVVFDMDGTLADFTRSKHRGPFDESRVQFDDPNHDIVALAKVLRESGMTMVVVSGRSEKARAGTREWLSEHVTTDPIPLFMRAAGDMRKDDIVKGEIIKRELEPNYNIIYWVDDRKQVVDFVRSMGIRVLQVAPGEF